MRCVRPRRAPSESNVLVYGYKEYDYSAFFHWHNRKMVSCSTILGPRAVEQARPGVDAPALQRWSVPSAAFCCGSCFAHARCFPRVPPSLRKFRPGEGWPCHKALAIGSTLEPVKGQMKLHRPLASPGATSPKDRICIRGTFWLSTLPCP
jgi:hypothetical protein